MDDQFHPVDRVHNWVSPSPFPTQPTVEQAEAALEEAKSRERRQHKAAKQQAKITAQKFADRQAGLAALREIAADDRKFSADARVIAAQALIAQAS